MAPTDGAIGLKLIICNVYTSGVNISRAHPSEASGLGWVRSQGSKSAPTFYKHRSITITMPQCNGTCVYTNCLRTNNCMRIIAWRSSETNTIFVETKAHRAGRDCVTRKATLSKCLVESKSHLEQIESDVYVVITLEFSQHDFKKHTSWTKRNFSRSWPISLTEISFSTLNDW